MTAENASHHCDICGHPGSVTMEPPRRTLARGSDPDDSSLSVIGVLPDVVLCDDYASAIGEGQMTLGWCDNERCRVYGVAGERSPCGELFVTLKR